jgi:hypothetical protein
MKIKLWLIISIMALWSAIGAAAEGKLKGYMFGDYYFNASGPNEKRNAFQIRRIYFTYDTQWDDHFSGRLRFESSDPGFGANGTKPGGKRRLPAVQKRWTRPISGSCTDAHLE